MVGFDDDLVAHGESETCALTDGLGGEEGVKQLGLEIFGDGGTVVGDADLDVPIGAVSLTCFASFALLVL